MSLSVVVQGLGWVSVVWLIAVHMLIHQGRLHRGGMAPRVAGAVAALVIVVASLLTELWPVFVLGLLWLRSELWHRHSPDEAWFPLPDEHPHPDLPEAELTHGPAGPGRDAPSLPDSHPESHREPHPDRFPLSGPSGSTVTSARPRSRPAAARAGTTTRPAGRTDSPHPHHPLISRHTVDVLFRIEMGLLVLVTLAAFGFWAYQERPGFEQRADTSLCSLMPGGHC